MPGVYDIVTLGFNYRMNEMQAAIGSEQVRKLPAFLEARRRNYVALETALRGTNCVHFLQSTTGRFESSYYCYSLLLDERLKSKRADIVAKLNARGVGTSVHYPHPVPRIMYYREKYGWRDGDFPVAAWLSDCSIALPVAPHVSLDDIAYMATVCKETLKEFDA